MIKWLQNLFNKEGCEPEPVAWMEKSELNGEVRYFVRGHERKKNSLEPRTKFAYLLMDGRLVHDEWEACTHSVGIKTLEEAEKVLELALVHCAAEIKKDEEGYFTWKVTKVDTK